MRIQKQKKNNKNILKLREELKEIYEDYIEYIEYINNKSKNQYLKNLLLSKNNRSFKDGNENI